MMVRRVLAVTVAATAVLIAAAAASAAPLPVRYDGLSGYAHVSSTASPPGANHWGCKPSAAHPRPVVLVHGTFGDMSDSWQALSPLLFNHGYCVFALNYGSYAGSGSLGIYARDRSRRRLPSSQRSSTASLPRLGHGRLTSSATRGAA